MYLYHEQIGVPLKTENTKVLNDKAWDKIPVGNFGSGSVSITA